MRRTDDSGNAILEFIFIAVIVMVPLVYVIVSVAAVQRSQLAVTQAAREAGRAFATSDTADEAQARVAAAVRLAFADQGLDDDAEVRFVNARADCSARQVRPLLVPGAEYAVCVARRADLPGVPTLIQGRGIRTVARYVVHLDDYRTVG